MLLESGLLQHELLWNIGWLCPLAVGILFSAGAGISAATVISGLGAAGTFASGVGTLFKSFGSDSRGGFKPAVISPAKGAYEQEALEFLADLYQALAASLGYTYNAEGQLIYTPTPFQQYRTSQMQSLADRDMMRSLGMEVPTFGEAMGTEELTAMYDEMARRRDELAATIMSGVPTTPVPRIAPGGVPAPMQPMEIGPFADPNLTPPPPPDEELLP